MDANGNVWAGNRDESSGGLGSIVHIGLQQNSQCVDRNGNGTIETSTGLGDIKPWLNPGGVDDNGGVSSAEDECIIHYTRTSGTNVRTVAVDGNNDVWIGGYGNRVHEKIDGATGAPVPGTAFNLGCGGYGGLVDGNGVLWSASLSPYAVMRYDTSTSTGACVNLGRYSYGLGIDNDGNIWNSNYTFNSITKIAPDGTILGAFGTGGATGDRGVTVTPDNDVWVANSHGSDVSRLSNAGILQAVIPVGNMPTGLSVDAEGKVWVTNYSSDNVMRIDPASNTVDLTVSLGPGARPYNYSDMTGSSVPAPPTAGNWSVVYDSGAAAAEEWTISWNAATPGDSSISVTASSGTDGMTFGSPQAMSNGGDYPAVGRYVKMEVSFSRASTGESPILYDLTIEPANEPPVCAEAFPSVEIIWPPNHNWVDVDILGVTDADGDLPAITINSIYQDEPVDTMGDGTFTPDGTGVGTDTAHVRAERAGSKKVPGNGRVYYIDFTADDGNGGACAGQVQVGVPHDRGKQNVPVPDGPNFDSTQLAP